MIKTLKAAMKSAAIWLHQEYACVVGLELIDSSVNKCHHSQFIL